MKAIAVFPKEKKIKLIDHPEPNITNPHHVKIKMIEVGVCGTDREICQFKYGRAPDDCEYLILGHESLGEVVEIGSAVTTVKPGDLVVTMVRRPCTHENCITCRAGQPDFCYSGDFKERGINQLHGFMTEYVVDEEKYMLRVPKELRDLGVLTEPLTITEKAVREIYFIQKRFPWENNTSRYALVIGAGPVALLAALVFIRRGFHTTVYSLESENEMRAKLAVELGAKYFSAKNISIDELAKKVPCNIDVVFDGSGASDIAFHTAKLLGYNGVFIWTGIPGTKEPVDVNAGVMMRSIVLKNQSIIGSVNAGRHDFQRSISSLQGASENLRHLSYPLIKHFDIASYADLLLKPAAPDIFKSVLRFS